MGVYQSVRNLFKGISATKAAWAAGLTGLAAIIINCGGGFSGYDVPASQPNYFLKDVNNDGKKDKITVMPDDDSVNRSKSLSWSLYIALGEENGQFGEQKKICQLRCKPKDINLKDLNDDKKEDIVYLIAQSQFENHKWALYLMTGNGDGTFNEAEILQKYFNAPEEKPEALK